MSGVAKKIVQLSDDDHHILVVDDDPDMLATMSYTLKGHQVTTALSPVAALELLKTKEFQVILSDFQMPEMKGIEFLKQSVELRPNAKRVLVSAFVDLMQSEEVWNQAKVHRVLAKPFKPEELLDVVENAIFEYVMEEENERLRQLALMDAVTGVANQRYFWDRLRSEYSRAQRFNRPLTVIIFDADHFKEINDEKGHLAGDQLLKAIADVLVKETRQMDIVARYGGDEFAVIMPELDGEAALTIAQRLRDRVHEDTGMSLSGGVASLPDAGSERELVARADALLLKVKKQGKGKVVQ